MAISLLNAGPNTQVSEPSDLAGLMPMYPFVTPTFAQTGEWVFSGDTSLFTSLRLVYAPASEAGGGALQKWTLYDGESSIESLSGSDAPEDATTLVFTTAGVTATRGYVCTLAPFTNAQIEIGKWTITPTQPISAGTGEPLYVDWDESDGWLFTDGADPTNFGNTDPDAVSLSVDYGGVTYTATRPPSAFEIAVGALPTGVTGKARDCILVIDCTATGAVAPTVAWGTQFHPRTDIETDLAIVKAGKRAVFYISEYAAGEFAVGGWVETAGGSGT